MAVTTTDQARELAARRERVTIRCEVCGAEREVIAQSGLRRPRTCSARCRMALMRRRRRDELTAAR